MIIKRKLFSEKEKKSSNDTNSKAKGAGVAIAGTVGNTILGIKSKKHMEGENTKEGEELFDKVKRLATKKGIKVDEVSKTGLGPAYSNNTIYSDGTKMKANIKTGYGRHGDLISHEFGHAHFDKGKAKGIGEKIGKAAHKVYLKGGALQHTVLAPVGGIIAGTRSGKKAAEKEAAGEKESKKNLATAFGTYATIAAANAGLGELARGRAYKKRKKELEKEKNKKKDDK